MYNLLWPTHDHPRVFVQTLPFFRVLPFQHGFSHKWIPWRLIQPAFKPRLDAKGKRHPSSASGQGVKLPPWGECGQVGGFVSSAPQREILLVGFFGGPIHTITLWNNPYINAEVFKKRIHELRPGLLYYTKPRKKRTLTFQYTGCLIGILILVCYDI